MRDNFPSSHVIPSCHECAWPIRTIDFKYEGGLEGDARKKAFAEYRAKHITPEEEAILKIGVSDGDFHYLVSGKIMADIGKGFAEAMMEVQMKGDTK